MPFPLTPANNQVTLENGIAYTYNSSRGAWYRTPVTALTSVTSNNFTVLNSIIFSDGTTQTSAASPNDSYARTTANTATNNITILQGVNTDQNNRITIAEGVDVGQNTRMTIIEGVDTAQNTRITVAEGVDLGQNTRMSIIEGVNTTQNTNITAADTKAQAAFDKANTSGNISITDDTTNNETYYPLLSTSTSGTLLTANTSSSKLSYVPSTGTLTLVDLNTTSDRKFKENIQPIDSAMEIINRIDGVSYNWKETGKKSYGIIAQQLQEILPELVSQEDRGLSVSYLPLIALLIEAVKEQQKQIEKLK
jgi:hypothetical protein